MIMAYFERKGCVQRNLYSNCVSLYYKKVLKKYRIVRCQVLVIGGDVGQSASGVLIEHFVSLAQFQGAVAPRPISA